MEESESTVWLPTESPIHSDKRLSLVAVTSRQMTRWSFEPLRSISCKSGLQPDDNWSYKFKRVANPLYGLLRCL